MNNNITPAHVTYEQAVWLKSIGFGVPQNKMYSASRPRPILGYDGEVKFRNGGLHECASTPFNWNDCTNRIGFFDYYSAPEQSVVVEWLRVNFGVWISIHSDIEGTKFSYVIYGVGECSFYDFNSPSEAYSAAFTYLMSNEIIKQK